MWRVLVVTAVVAVAACVSRGDGWRAPAHPLYFAVELSQDGKRIGAPRLIGMSGKRVIAERRAPGATASDYRLVLEPAEVGPAYQLSLEVDLPSGHGRGEALLLHGEERTVPLGRGAQAKVLLMRVDSEEFRLLMAPGGPTGNVQQI